MAAVGITDHVVKQVLGVALKRSEKAQNQKDRVYVGQFFTRIRGIPTTEDVVLKVEDIDDVVRSAVFSCILHNNSPLDMLADTHARCVQDRSAVDAGRNPYQFPNAEGNTEKIREGQTELIKVLETINTTVISNASLLIVCPMFFNLEDLVAKQDLRKPPLDILDQNVIPKLFTEVALRRPSSKFIQDVLEHMWDNDADAAKEVLFRVFAHIRTGVSLTPIGVSPTAELGALSTIAASKVGASVLVSWLMRQDLGNIVWKSCGVRREIWSLLGRLFSSLPMTEEQLEAAKLMNTSNQLYDNAKNARMLYFQGKRDIASLRMSLATLREDHESYIGQVATFVKGVLRSSEETRTEMLVLLGQLIGCNTSKRHMSRLTHIDQPPVSLDDNFRRRSLFMPDSTYGTSLNIAWLLLILASGITEKKVESIDPNFCQLGFYIKHRTNQSNEGNIENRTQNDMRDTEILSSMDGMLGFLSTNNAGMGDEKELLGALESQKIDINTTYNAKFITQIFWTTLHGIGMLYLPSLQEFLKIIIHTLQIAQSSDSPHYDEGLMEVLSHVLTWKCVMQNAKFIEALWHYINISLVFFIRCALIVHAKDIDNEQQRKLEGRSLCIKLVDMYASGKLRDSDRMDPHFTVLPVDFIEIILDVLKHMAIMRYYVSHLRPEDGNVLEFMDFDLVMATCIYIMKSPQSVIKNLTLKSDTVSAVILNLSKANGIENFSQSEISKRHLIDALTITFVMSQKSDYNSRTTCRINIIQTLTKLFEIDAYRTSFVKNIIVNKENFVQFMHLLLSDTSFIFEEIVSFLTEIRRREQAGITEEPREQPQQGGSTSTQETQNNEEEEVEPMLQEGAIDANQLMSMSFKELQGRARNLVEYGSEITTLLLTLCREFNKEITTMTVLLPQFASCLGCCLDNLAGENSSRLKVKNMMQYNFQPKAWLSNVVKCYLSLYGEDNNEHSEALMKAIVSEGRYFKPANFERAFRVITREMLLNSSDRRTFFNMSQKLFQYAKATNTLYQNAMEAEIPEEFMDPIMMDIMEEPVLLPTSGMVMDRKNIERHLMSEATDPFSRQPLSKADLVPQPELKKKIDDFMASLTQKNDATDDIYRP